MRIDLYNVTASIEATRQSSKLSAENSQAAKNRSLSQTEDTTTLSSSSDSVQSLTQIALETIPSRTAKVDSLKQAVSSGQYQLDPAKIADALATSDV